MNRVYSGVTVTVSTAWSWMNIVRETEEVIRVTAALDWLYGPEFYKLELQFSKTFGEYTEDSILFFILGKQQFNLFVVRQYSLKAFCFVFYFYTYDVMEKE